MIRLSVRCGYICLLMTLAAVANSDELAGFNAYYLGGSFSDENHYSIEASADFLLSRRHWLGFAAMHSDGQGASASVPGARSAAFDLGFGGEIKQAHYSVGATWTNEHGLGNSLRYQLAFGKEHKRWAWSMSTEWRETRHQLSNFNALLRSIDAILEAQLRQQLQARFPEVEFNDVIALQADLDIRSLAYSLDLTYKTNDALRLYGSYTYYDFREAPDRLGLSAGLNRFGDTNRGQRVLAQINQALANSVDGLAGDFRQGFYARSTAIGMEFDRGNNSWLVELAHDKDAISGQAIRSASVQWIAPLARTSDVRIAISHRQAGKPGNSNQIGFGVFFYH